MPRDFGNRLARLEQLHLERRLERVREHVTRHRARFESIMRKMTWTPKEFCHFLRAIRVRQDAGCPVDVATLTVDEMHALTGRTGGAKPLTC